MSPRRSRKANRTVAANRGTDTWRATCAMVAANLPDHLLPLWDRRKLYGTGSVDERTEAFLEYAEAHPREVLEAMERSAEKRLKAMIAAYENREPTVTIAVDEECPF